MLAGVVTHPPRKTRFRLLVRLYRTGLVTTAVNIFEKQRNLLWANDLKQLITCCNYNYILIHILFYIVNANLIVKIGDMGWISCPRPPR